VLPHSARDERRLAIVLERKDWLQSRPGAASSLRLGPDAASGLWSARCRCRCRNVVPLLSLARAAPTATSSLSCRWDSSSGTTLRQPGGRAPQQGDDVVAAHDHFVGAMTAKTNATVGRANSVLEKGSVIESRRADSLAEFSESSIAFRSKFV
jgi:hypothetical protein